MRPLVHIHVPADNLCVTAWWWYSCCSVSALSFTDAVWLWCTCVLRPQQDLARYKKHVLAVVAAANASRSEPLTAENVNAMVVEDRTPHLGQIEVGDVPGVCVGLAARRRGCAHGGRCRWGATLQIRVTFLKNIMSHSTLRLTYDQVRGWRLWWAAWGMGQRSLPMSG